MTDTPRPAEAPFSLSDADVEAIERIVEKATASWRAEIAATPVTAAPDITVGIRLSSPEGGVFEANLLYPASIGCKIQHGDVLFEMIAPDDGKYSNADGISPEQPNYAFARPVPATLSQPPSGGQGGEAPSGDWAAGVEAAAKVCEQIRDGYLPPVAFDISYGVADECATTIRALTPPQSATPAPGDGGEKRTGIYIRDMKSLEADRLEVNHHPDNDMSDPATKAALDTIIRAAVAQDATLPTHQPEASKDWVRDTAEKIFKSFVFSFTGYFKDGDRMLSCAVNPNMIADAIAALIAQAAPAHSASSPAVLTSEERGQVVVAECLSETKPGSLSAAVVLGNLGQLVAIIRRVFPQGPK